MSDLQPNPLTLLEEGLSDKLLSTKKQNARLSTILHAAEIAIPAVLRAASAGNVECREAAVKILEILK